MPDSLKDQLTKYLADVHSIEEQALQQLRSAPKIADDEQLARLFSEHLSETEDQERRVRERLDAVGGDPSKTKDVIARLGGVAMILFARSQPDTPGKLVAHAYSYEHLEIAAYDLLGLAARRGGDGETAAVADAIKTQETAMAERLADNFGRAVDASLAAVEPGDLEDQLVSYLADAHAIEVQAIGLLEKGLSIAGDDTVATAFADHLEETRSHQAVIEARLDEHEAGPSRIKDAALKVGALNLGASFTAQPDTPAKLAGFAFAFEHLEVAAYELLRRVAMRAGDDETVRATARILEEEHAAAQT